MVNDGSVVSRINVYQESGEKTRFAKNVLRDDKPIGQHVGEEHSFFAIESRPTGSGQNFPDSADYGVTISHRKKDASRYCTPGEIDGLNIVVAQGGEKSDAAGTLVNVANLGNGFTTAHEYVVSSYNDANSAIVRQTRGQIGVTDTANAHTFGMNVSMDIGNDGVAYRCDTKPSQWWAKFLQFYNDGVEKYSVDGNGVTRGGSVCITGDPQAGFAGGVSYGGTWSYVAPQTGTLTVPTKCELFLKLMVGGSAFVFPGFRV